MKRFSFLVLDTSWVVLDKDNVRLNPDSALNKALCLYIQSRIEISDSLFWGLILDKDYGFESF